MRKAALLTAICGVCAWGAWGAWAQDAPGTPIRTVHYELQAMDEAERDLSLLGREMELRFETYNALFRFDTALLKRPLKVKVFVTQAAYDLYVSARLGGARPGAVYLHYTNTDRRELCLLRGSIAEETALPHQAFIQFFKGFIANPPLWMQEGFAIFFSTLRFDPAVQGQDGQDGALVYEENLSWLEYVKNLGRSAPALRNLLEADSYTNAGIISPSNFQGASWGLVSLFISSGRGEYYRTITDCFMVLSPEAPAKDNCLAVERRITQWIDFSTMENDFFSYLDTRKTFMELMAAGIKAYGGGDAARAEAEASFRAALAQRPSHYAPYYYLGLMAYDAGNFEDADNYYRASLERGADEALVYYAMGINAVSAGKRAEAEAWLQTAADKDPGRYRAKAEAILRARGGSGAGGSQPAPAYIPDRPGPLR